MSDDQPPIYAGFVTRATGLVVDEVLILVIGVAGVIGAGLVLDAVIPGGVSIDLASIVGAAAWSVVLSTAYFVGFWSLAGQTPGMRLMGVLVVPDAAPRLTLWRGLALVLVDDRRQGLHDKIAGTLVLYGRED